MITDTLDILESPSWMRLALCADADPDLFFPEPGEHSTPKVKAAIRICNHCPVKRSCLRWAFETGDRWAILGGKTPQQRTYIARRIWRRKNGDV